MSARRFSLRVDGIPVEAAPGQSILQACDAAGVYIPRLCDHPDLPPAGHCRVCICLVDGRRACACTTPAAAGQVVLNDTPELQDERRAMVELLFIEGNHYCHFCERSGDCELQALGYRLGMSVPRWPYLWPRRELDGSHPDVFIDHDRCILCSRCIRASRLEDGKSLFGFEGRGIRMRLKVEAEGHLDATALAAADQAVRVCPVGCIGVKRTAFRVPRGMRRYDQTPIGADIEARREPLKD
ncbi:2Fe-2S iron-sulfur cluster-binding protein [Aquabacterium sp. A7-Y]|uniref:2Fe-2S iron-sulfur cluster-binding protein n=1 Tax=Aquabacterium sp. A7-Y TaxID=1349605 RepID=UPI00223DF0B1|nr:2Fe-2S iron-sulfur cluster-binding protein [Aquabacterium sp. A7-Y]MCW7541114.1 2Fe-2S iron-sulfur cluster-binding protein [Aquabacterium sp. A7-Y]